MDTDAFVKGLISGLEKSAAKGFFPKGKIAPKVKEAYLRHSGGKFPRLGKTEPGVSAKPRFKKGRPASWLRKALEEVTGRKTEGRKVYK